MTETDTEGTGICRESHSPGRAGRVLLSWKVPRASPMRWFVEEGGMARAGRTRGLQALWPQGLVMLGEAGQSEEHRLTAPDWNCTGPEFCLDLYF